MTTYRATHQRSAAAPQPARTLPDKPVPASEPQTNVTSCICAAGFAAFWNYSAVNLNINEQREWGNLSNSNSLLTWWLNPFSHLMV